MSNKICPGAGWLSRGHHFEPRYDTRPSEAKQHRGGLMIMTVDETIAAINATVERTYVMDVCTRCGETVRRDKSEGSTP